MFKAKQVYKAHVDGSTTVEEQIEIAKNLSISGGYTDRQFEISLKYEMYRTVTSILSNATIMYQGWVSPLAQSIMDHLIDIYFALHDNGYCYLKFNENGSISGINQTQGYVKLVDKAWLISKSTQKVAVKKAMEYYGIVFNSNFSIVDERGVFGVFSPQKDTQVKTSQIEKLYDSLKYIFGGKKGQRKFAITEVPMTYSGVSIPVKELELDQKLKDATAMVARLYGISTDMILGGSTFENKENAIIQTYTEFGGWIYGIITQIEKELSTFRIAEDYTVTFPSVPQMNKPKQLPA